MKKINKVVSFLAMPLYFLASIALRLLLVLLGLVILPPLVAYCQKKGLQKFPKLFYIWDNDEDGYTGNQRWHWWDVYLDGFKMPHEMRDWYGRTDLSFFSRWKRSVKWSAIRNPVNNMQKAKLTSWKTKDPLDFSIKRYDNGGYVIWVRPQDSLLYHICFKFNIKGYIFRGGLKVKDWYYTDPTREIEEYRERTTYTLSFFKD